MICGQHDGRSPQAHSRGYPTEMAGLEAPPKESESTSAVPHPIFVDVDVVPSFFA